MNPFRKQLGFSAQGGPASGWALPIVILIVVILIVAGGAGYYFYKISKAPKVEELPSAEEFCESITDSVKRDICYYNLALEAEDASLCGKITNNWEKGECCLKVAQKTKDSGLCEKITTNLKDRKSVV